MIISVIMDKSPGGDSLLLLNLIVLKKGFIMNTASYPQAYCVKCKAHTETKSKHTVILQNNARALTGTCPDCASQVYKFMPKKSQPQKQIPVNHFEKAPNRSQTPITNRTHYNSPNFSLNTRPSAATIQSSAAFDYTALLWSIIAFTGGIIIMAMLK